MKHTCTCIHPSQDKLHGKSVRIWNEAPGKGGDKKGRYRCTVCGAERNITK